MSTILLSRKVDFVNSRQKLQILLRRLLTRLDLDSTTIYLDFGSTDFSNSGMISLKLSRPLRRRDCIYLLDVAALKESAGENFFTCPGSMVQTPTHGCRSLKDILESEDMKKIIFDVRDVSRTLFTHYNIILRGVIDLQVMEIVARRSIGIQSNLVRDLDVCIKEDSPVSKRDIRRRTGIEEKRRKLLVAAQHMNFYNRHAIPHTEQRKIKKLLTQNIAQNVQFLPGLQRVYQNMLRYGTTKGNRCTYKFPTIIFQHK